MEFWVQLNGRLADKWADNNITKKIDAMPGYEEWSGKPMGERIDLLEE